MNKTSFRGMEQGKVYVFPALALKLEDRITKNGKPFVCIGLSDGNTSINANLFNTSVTQLSNMQIEAGEIVSVEIKKNDPYYNIISIGPCDDPYLSKEDFARSIDGDIDTIFDQMCISIELSRNIKKEHAKNASLADITLSILKEHEKEFKHSAAGQTIHHNLIGGLLLHSANMVDHAYRICYTYPFLNRELLVCGAALHDIGKIKELYTDEYGDTTYTAIGRLLGHSLIGVHIIDDAARNFTCPQATVDLLEHLVASHHGKKDWGAIADPAIPEAECLHELDRWDSKAYQYEEALTDMEPGTISKKIYGLDNNIYNPAA